MTKEEAKRMLKEEGLTYGDAVMLVSSFVPEGMSESWSISQEAVKRMILGAIERIRQQKGTSDFKFCWRGPDSNFYVGYCILREFG